MIAVGDCPCLWLAPENLAGPAPLRVRAVLPSACRADPRDRAEQVAVVERMTGSAVLVLPEDVLPGTALSSMRADPLLLGHGLPVGWLSRNAVTGELVGAPGPTLWPRDRLLAVLHDRPSPPPGPAVVPLVAADWAFNRDAAGTFATAFASVLERRDAAAGDPSAAARLAVHASLGADAPFGTWWIIGACQALLGYGPAAEALATELREVPDRDAAALRARDLVREARHRTGLGLVPLTADESRFYKQLRFKMPPRSVYLDLAAVYDRLGAAGAVAAERHRQAAAWVWGGRTQATRVAAAGRLSGAVS